MMAAEIGHSAWLLAEGHRRWLLDHDFLAAVAAQVGARTLIEFFAGRKDGRKTSDLHPSDLLDDFEEPANVEEMRHWLRQLDQHMAHLSLARAEGELVYDPPWNEIVEDLLRRCEDLADRLAGKPGELELRVPVRNARAALQSCGGRPPTD